MDFSLSYYNYATVMVLGVLLALIVLLLRQKTRRDGAFATYRRARACLIGVYAVIFIDMTLSLVVNNTPGLGENADTAVDVLCYTPTAILFTWMVSWLIDENAEYRLKIVRDVALWLMTLLLVGITFFIPEQSVVQVIVVCVAVFWSCFIFYFGIRIIRSFRRAVARLNNFYSEDVASRIGWLMNSFLTFVIFGLCGPVVAVSPAWVNMIYNIVGGVVYAYVCSSMLNYYESFELVDRVTHPEDEPGAAGAKPKQSTGQNLAKIKDWEEKNGHWQAGVTIADVAKQLGMTELDVAKAVNDTYGCSFREHINRLRVHDAQELLVHYPEKPVAEVATMLGYRTEEEMASLFKQITNVTPSEWRKGVLRLMS